MDGSAVCYRDQDLGPVDIPLPRYGALGTESPISGISMPGILPMGRS